MFIDIRQADAATQASYAFMVAQTAHIETELNEVTYEDLQYAQLVPIDTSAPEFTKTVTYYSMDTRGQAKFINGNASDIPTVSTAMGQHETAVLTAALGYDMSWEELGQARMLGHNIDTEKAGAARRIAEEQVDRVVMAGDPDVGLQGLVNIQGVTEMAFAAGAGGNDTFEAMTDDEIISRMNSLIRLQIAGTLRTDMADTLLLPNTTLDHLGERKFKDTDDTVLAWFRKHNAFTNRTGRQLDIRGIDDLETAAAGGNKRMMAYRRAPDVLKFHMPMPHRFLAPVPQVLGSVVPGVQRFGGLNVKKPASLRYATGF